MLTEQEIRKAHEDGTVLVYQCGDLYGPFLVQVERYTPDDEICTAVSVGTGNRYSASVQYFRLPTPEELLTL